FRLPFGHQTVLKAALDHPNIYRISDDKADKHPERHYTPEEQVRRFHGAHVPPHHEQAHRRSHTGHHRVHADEFRQESAAHVLQISAAHHLFHEERLKDKETEGKARDVLDNKIQTHR